MKWLLPAVLLFCASSANAQTVAAVPSRCDGMTAPVMETLKKLPYPKDWKIVVACNDVVWEHFRAHAGRPGTHVAFTSIPDRITIVRGSRMQFPEPLESPRTVLTHELGHILSNSSDETDANRKAKELELGENH